jgi:hypothetical protein
MQAVVIKVQDSSTRKWIQLEAAASDMEFTHSVSIIVTSNAHIGKTLRAKGDAANPGSPSVYYDDIPQGQRFACFVLSNGDGIWYEIEFQKETDLNQFLALFE